MGMNAERGVNPVMLLGDLDGAIERPRSSATANGQNALQAGFAGAGEHFVAIAVEFVAFQMSVGIDVQECSPRYFSLVPTGTSSRKPASTGLPSSPTEAAKIIPLDSIPRSLRGARLATSTTLRPISGSSS